MKTNNKDCLRIKREGRYLVEYVMSVVKNWSYYRTSYNMNFLDAIVRILGSKEDYEKFKKYREEHYEKGKLL